jgi:16S rRNA (guanine(966)-N(2))-methyltransferase RsmD
MRKSLEVIILPSGSAHTARPLPYANQIRIISGRWRGRRIRFPPREGVRPTPDRVRETLFNWLGQDLTGASTLDPFAGSGALSLEALSRGAALAVAVDRNPVLVRSLARAGAALGTDRLEIHCMDARAYLVQEKRLFDVIFLDPPFDCAIWPALLASAAKRLAPGGAIYAEAAALIEGGSGLVVSRRHKAGQVHYHLLRHASA